MNLKIKRQAILKAKQYPVVLKMQCFHTVGILPSVFYLSKANQPHCILMALHFQKKALHKFF